MRPVEQRNTDTARPQDGDCFAACVATVLRLDLAAVPNFCARHYAHHDWWAEFQAWLVARDLFAIELAFGATLAPLPDGAPVILSGRSPRGDWLHSVVGVAEKNGFRYYHDPNPAGDWLVGEPTQVLFICALNPYRAPLLRDRVTEDSCPKSNSPSSC